LQIIGHIFAVIRGVRSLTVNTLLRGELLNWDYKIWREEARNIVGVKIYFDILNRLGCDHEFDGRIDW